MTIDYGSDISAVPSLDPLFRIIPGTATLPQDCYKRLTCGWLFYAPAATIDVRFYLSAAITDQGLYNLKAAVEHVLMQDERIVQVTAAPTFNFSTRTLALPIQLQTSLGPFQLVLSVTAATVNLVSVSRPQPNTG